MKKIISILIIMLFLITPLAISTNIKETTNKVNIGNPYTGYLRIYLTEIDSKINMYNGEPYHFALSDIPYETVLSLDYLESFEENINFDGMVSGDNLMVIAAVFNPESNTNYANPPYDAPFDAYFVDAAVGTRSGETSSNGINGNFTHTIFIEEGTATWCPYCPEAGEVLYSIYESGDYPFYYIAMVVDKNEAADNRMDDFNLHWLPTSFCDGGNAVIVGADENEIREAIELSGQRDVNNLELTLSVEYLGSGEIDIYIKVTNIENKSPDIPTIDGVSSGSAGTEYEYTFQSTDPEGQDISYCIDWGDGAGEVCLSPVQSGEEVTATHSWTEQDTYIIKAKARDSEGVESDWATLEVSMPKNKSNTYSFMRFLDNFPFISHILDKLMK